jgi:hypothetical protein
MIWTGAPLLKALSLLTNWLYMLPVDRENTLAYCRVAVGKNTLAYCSSGDEKVFNTETICRCCRKLSCLSTDAAVNKLDRLLA